MTEPEQPGGRRRLLLAGLALAVVAAVVVAVLVVGGDDDSDGGATADGSSGLDAITVPDEAVASGDLTGLAAEVVALLEARSQLTYHATYEGTGGEIGDVAIEELRDGPERHRTDSRSGDQETRTLLVDGQAVVCTRSGEDPFTCTADAATAAVDPFTGSIAEQLAGVVLTETDTTDVGGRDARCFTFAAEDGPGELCIDERGIPLRLAVGEVRLELTALDDDVPAAAFVPPAEPTPGVTIEDPTIVDDAPAGG